MSQQGLGVGEQPVELGDRARQLVALGLQLDAAELRQPPQRHLEDVGGLDLGQVEHAHQPRARGGGVVAGADHGDDLVDVEDRHEQAVDQVQPLRGAGRVGRRCAGARPRAGGPRYTSSRALRPSVWGWPSHQGDVVDPEGLLQRGQPVELLEHGLGHEPALDLDDQLQALLAVGQVGDPGDAGDLLGVVTSSRIRSMTFSGPTFHGSSVTTSARAPRGQLLDPGGGPHPEGAAAGLVGLADTVEAHDPPTGGQVRAGHEAHEVVEVGIRMGQQVPWRGHDLAEVVRGHVGRHADGDARGAVDQQVRVRRRQHHGLELAAVVVGREVDDVLVEAGHHRQGRAGHPALGVPVGGRAVVRGAEVAVAVDQGHAAARTAGPCAPARRRSRRRRAGAAGPSPRRRRARS